MKYLCPTCRNELEELKACGACDYFCNSCKTLVSRSAIIPKDNEQSQSQKLEEEGAD